MAEQVQTGFVQDDEDQKPAATRDIYQEDLLEDMPLDIYHRVDAEHDMHRIRSATALINTFNYAIQVQGGRSQWQASDYHRFVRALIALDSIGSEAVAATRVKRVEDDIRDAVKQQVQPQEALPAEVEKFAPAKRQSPISSLPKQPQVNQIRGHNDVIRDDLRLPRDR
jgi:hypothetical protein